MTEYTFRIWTRTGPRDQANCVNGWGRRTATAAGPTRDAALASLIDRIGRENYGGLAD